VSAGSKGLLTGVAVLALIVAWAAPVRGADALRGPWYLEKGELPSAPGAAGADGAGSGAGLDLVVRFYRRVISPIDGSRCPSYPTCTAYSLEAYARHGAILGTLMTVDRLLHEASEGRYSPLVRVHGVRRIYDPLVANEFWRHPRGVMPGGRQR